MRPADTSSIDSRFARSSDGASLTYRGFELASPRSIGEHPLFVSVARCALKMGILPKPSSGKERQKKGGPLNSVKSRVRGKHIAATGTARSGGRDPGRASFGKKKNAPVSVCGWSLLKKTKPEGWGS
jgi:hypothetical protein